MHSSNIINENCADISSHFLRCKVLLFGCSQSGKTAIANSFVEGLYLDDYLPTFGVEVCVKTLEKVKLKIFDREGGADFNGRTPSYYQETDAILICLPMNNKNFDDNKLLELQSFIDEINAAKIQYSHQFIPDIYLIGTKSDKLPIDLSQREKIIDSYQNAAGKHNMLFFPVSAKNYVKKGEEDLDRLFSFIISNKLKNIQIKKSVNEMPCDLSLLPVVKVTNLDNKIDNILKDALDGINAYKKLPRTHLNFVAKWFDNKTGIIRSEIYFQLLSNSKLSIRQKVLVLLALLSGKEGHTLQKEVVNAIADSDILAIKNMLNSWLQADKLIEESLLKEMIENIAKFINSKPSDIIIPDAIWNMDQAVRLKLHGP